MMVYLLWSCSRSRRLVLSRVRFCLDSFHVLVEQDRFGRFGGRVLRSYGRLRQQRRRIKRQCCIWLLKNSVKEVEVE